MTPQDKCPRCGAAESASEYSKAYACGTLVSSSGRLNHTNTCRSFSELRKPLDIERDQLAARVKELEEYVEKLEEAGNEMAAWNFHPLNLGGDASLACAWDQAKETRP